MVEGEIIKKKLDMNWKNLGLKILVVIIFAIADAVTDLGLPLWVAPFLYWIGEWVKGQGGLKELVAKLSQ